MEPSRMTESAVAVGLMLMVFFTLAVLAAVEPAAVVVLSIPALVLYRLMAGHHPGRFGNATCRRRSG